MNIKLLKKIKRRWKICETILTDNESNGVAKDYFTNFNRGDKVFTVMYNRHPVPKSYWASKEDLICLIAYREMGYGYNGLNNFEFVEHALISIREKRLEEKKEKRLNKVQKESKIIWP